MKPIIVMALLAGASGLSERTALLARAAEQPTLVAAPVATLVATPVAATPVTAAPVVALAAPVPAPLAAAVVAAPTVQLGLTVPGLRIAGGGAPTLVLGAQDAPHRYEVGVDGGGALTVTHTEGATVSELLSVRNGQLHTTVPLQAGHVQLTGWSVAGVSQWVLVARDDFSEPPAPMTDGAGWSETATSQCGGVAMLGGYCHFGKQEVTRTLAGLPPHTQIRIQATYHFIDRWVGETGYMKMDIGTDGGQVPVWTESHSQDHEVHGMNVCGQEKVHEGKFAQRIDVSVPHNKPSVTLAFGATMSTEDPCDESWGLSNLEVYVRAPAPA